MDNLSFFTKEDIEEIILKMADMVYENRKLEKENYYLKKEVEENRKRTAEMVQTNLQNTVDFLTGALKEKGDNYE